MKSTHTQRIVRALSGLVLVVLLGARVQAQTLYDITVTVKLDGNVVAPLYDDDNYIDPGEVEGLTINGECDLGSDFVTPGNVIELEACGPDASLPFPSYPGDTLTLHILNPNLYRTSPFGQVSIDHWEVNNVNSGSSALITHNVTDNADIEVFLTQTVDEIRRDPVSARWNPDAGRRSGGDLTWGPAWLSAKSQVSDVGSEGYPALLYSGEAYEKQVDLAVKGRGLDFVFSRVHRSGAPEGDLDDDEGNSIDNFGFGGQWTHNFDIAVESPNLTSFVTPAKVRLGNGTKINFHQKYVALGSPSYRYFYAEGWDAELELKFASPNYTYQLRFGDGVVWTFLSFTNTTARTLRLESIADRFGNTMSFAYDGSGHLETITDTLGRAYTLAYSGEALIESLTEEDGLGRVIAYGYNGDDELTTVTYPATTAFPNPHEPTITYDYDGDGRLTTVSDPRGNATLTNTYNGEGTLVSQQLGDGAEAGTVTYDYTGLALMGGEDHGVRVTDGAEHKTEHYFNAMNQLLRLVQLDVNDEDFTTTTITWSSHTFKAPFTEAIEFDVSDDLPASITLPDGGVVEYHYQGPGEQPTSNPTDPHPDYKYRMNPTQVTRTGTDGKTLAEELGHNDLGGSVPYWDARFGESFVTCHSLRDGGGTLLSATAYTYSSDGLATLDGIDYYGIDPYAGTPFSACPTTGGESMMMLSGMESFAMESLLESEEIYSSMFQQFESASELYEFNFESFGFDGGMEMILTSLTPVAHHDEFLYNEHGQLTDHLHPDNDEDGESSSKVRRRDVYTYTDGYLTGQTIDSGGLNLTTRFENDAVGRVEYITAPNVTEAVPDENKKTTITYDELDQVTMVEEPLIHNDTATDYRPTTDYAYDENENLTRTRHHWTDKDGAPKSTAGESEASSYLATEYGYDTRNRLNAISREDGTGLTVSKIEYDGNGNVVKRLSPLAVANTDPNNVVTYEYDVRDLPIRIKRGNAVATRIDYDAGGRVVRMVEGYGTPEARSASTAYDGLGHIQSTLDAAGLTTEYTTDALGRVVKTVVKDGPNVLAHTDYAYDLAGRLTNINQRHWDATGASVGDGWLRTVLDYTDAGMLLSEEVEGDVTSGLYDTAMRLEQVNSPGGNRQNYAYDANGNPLTATEHAYDTAAEAETVFITRYGYDPLDRLVSMGRDDGDGVQNDANTTGYAYDSLGQLEEIEDALGNLTVNAYDPLGRLDSTTRDPGAHPHIDAVVDYEYDANDRLTEVTDPNGGVTNYIYDDLNRHVETVYADGQRERFTYDALDNLVEHVAPGGLATHTAFDAAGRPVAQHYTSLSGRMDPGETTWTYDVLGRVREAKNAGSTVSHAYDSLGNPAIERVRYGSKLLEPVKREYDQKGLLESINPPGTENEVKYTRNPDGLVTVVERNGAVLANFGYLGARPNARELVNGGTAFGGTMIGYEDTGLRPGTIVHGSATIATVDTRSFAWDGAYNLDGFQVTGGSLAASAVDLDYDSLNRIDPTSIGATWALDKAGNRTGTDYSLDGQDALMHRYTSVGSLPQFHDAQGARTAVGIDANSLHLYRYDVKDRLDSYRRVTLASSTPFNALDILDGDWSIVNGAWSVNDNGTSGDPADDYLEETSSAAAAILYEPAALPEHGFTFRYRLNPPFDSNEYPAKYYAQVLLYVDASAGPPYPYVALRIEPDRMSIVYYDGSAIEEVDSVAVETAVSAWYTVELWQIAGGPGGGSLSVVRTSDTAGDALAMLLNMPLADAPEATAIGFTVGEAANYHFQLEEYAAAPDVAETFIDWDYDAYGRKIAETVYDNTNTVTSQTLYVYDGWRLVSELDALHNYRVVAEYVAGPTYVDDTVAARRDLNRDGDFADANEGFLYHLTDQQHSTVALLNGGGDVVERYAYNLFGAPSFHDGAGAPLAQSAVSNTRLYTGRDYLPALGLYDLRQRAYDPATGRFLTTDPIGSFGDPANLGNPYTYVANNPGSFVDPYGEERWGTQSYGVEVFDVAYGYFIAAPLGVVGGAASAIWNYDQTIAGAGELAGSLYEDFGGTLSSGARAFASQFEDTDTAGQGVFDVATIVVPGGAGAAKAAGRVGSVAKGAARAAGKLGAKVDLSAMANSIAAKLSDESGMVIKPTEFAKLLYNSDNSLKPYQVGTADMLKSQSKIGDQLDIHHVGQSHAMKQIVPNYDPATAPAIALPHAVHTRIPKLRGEIQFNARQLLSRDIMNLRKYTDAPNSSLQEIISMHKHLYPNEFTK